MDLVILVARLFLAAMFLFAALTKLTDRAGTRRMVGSFGVPDWLAGIGATVLPPLEVAAAALLLPASTAWYGALTGLAPLTIFTGGMAANLARGRHPDCRCFGQIGAGPIGVSSLARNGSFLLVALMVALAGPQQPAFDLVMVSGAPVAELALALAAAGLGISGVALVLVLCIVRTRERILRQLEAVNTRVVRSDTAQTGASTAARPVSDGGSTASDASAHASSSTPAPALPFAGPRRKAGLPVGAPAPAFSLPDLHGVTRSLASLLAEGRPLLLLFVDPHCEPCASLLPDVARWQRVYGSMLSVIVVSRGSAADNRIKTDAHNLTSVLLQRDFEVAGEYRVPGAPSAVVVAADGTIATPAHTGPVAVRTLVDEFIGLTPPIAQALP